MMDINQEARGRWESILISAGIDQKHLTGKHGPCPMCGGKDRFRFDNKEGRGTYYCSQCGAGDGVKLVMEYKGVDFKTAACEIRKVLPDAVEFKIPKKKNPLPRLKRVSAGLTRIGPEVTAYLNGRGIMPRCWKDIREHPNAEYFEDGVRRTYPAMVGIITDAQGVNVSLHMTYLKDGQKAPVKAQKKILPPVKPITGCSVKLGYGEVIGVTEGIETAMAVQARRGIPVWAAISANGMETLEIPNDVKVVEIYADNDENYTGQQAAFALAKRLQMRKTGPAVEVLIPTYPGTDFADEYTNQRLPS